MTLLKLGGKIETTNFQGGFILGEWEGTWERQIMQGKSPILPPSENSSHACLSCNPVLKGSYIKVSVTG